MLRSRLSSRAAGRRIHPRLRPPDGRQPNAPDRSRRRALRQPTPDSLGRTRISIAVPANKPRRQTGDGPGRPRRLQADARRVGPARIDPRNRLRHPRRHPQRPAPCPSTGCRRWRQSATDAETASRSSSVPPTSARKLPIRRIFSLWRDPDSNRGHHDFQSIRRTSRKVRFCGPFVCSGCSPRQLMPPVCGELRGVWATGRPLVAQTPVAAQSSARQPQGAVAIPEIRPS